MIDHTKIRKAIGKEFKLKRVSYGYTIKDFAEISNLALSTINKIENGIIVNIDLYLHYALKINYPLKKLLSQEHIIDNQYYNKLPPNKKKPLTHSIRSSILEKRFLDRPKSLSEIQNELIRLGLISDKENNSIAISGILRNFVNKKQLKIVQKIGRKNIYLINQIKSDI